MIDVVFGFDVEDPVNANADGALLRICRIFSEEGVSASLFTAAEKARTIRRRGRKDVIDAMAEHEICYHGNYWGEYPVPALEYGQDMEWDEAVSFALEIETPGLHDIADITGQFPVAWCVHQANWCPQMAYALKLAGVRCCAGGPRGWIMDWLSWGRANCTASSQPAWQQHVDPTRRDEIKPPMDLNNERELFHAHFNRLAETQEFITIVGHPTCWVNADWGGLYEYAMIFRHGAPGPFPRPATIAKAQPRSSQDQEVAFEFLRDQIRWLKSRDDVNLTSYAALCDRDDEPSRWVTLEQAISLGKRMSKSLNHISDYGTTFSCADVLGMLTFACDYCWRVGKWPEQIPVQRLLGPTEPPMALDEPVTLTRENIFAGALAAYSIMMDERRIPGTLRASMYDVGPGTWMHVLAEFVSRSVQGDDMPLSVTVHGAPTLPDCADEDPIKNRGFGSSNRRPGLSMDPLWDIWRWQSWSYRPALSQR